MRKEQSCPREQSARGEAAPAAPRGSIASPFEQQKNVFSWLVRFDRFTFTQVKVNLQKNYFYLNIISTRNTCMQQPLALLTKNATIFWEH